MSLVLVLVSAKPTAGQNPPSSGTWCGLLLSGETRNRHVYGAVNAECGSCVGHTAPFGNWGVYSYFGSSWDGDQYKGWKEQYSVCNEDMDDPEWNSCTGDFQPPSSTYYNHPSGVYTSQFSEGETSLGWVWDWYPTNEDDGCAVLDSSQLSGGTVLEIYELDPWSSDQHVTDLSVGSGSVALSCSRESCAGVSTSWGGGSNGVTSADFRVRVIGSCLYIDGKGCV